MAFFALLWKARTIEKYRVNYEKEKINSIAIGHTQMEQTLSQKWRSYRYDTKKRISRTFKKWYPDGSGVSNFFLYLRTDQTFPNFFLKSVMGFVGGIILTYLCFMFFVFQLSISLIHATFMSSIIGVLLTLGLAFSYRIRCLVFLLIPQFFSRVGRYTLTCYALVLILTGPATNTLKNSEVLSESMACCQEQIKTSMHQLNNLMKKPYNVMKDSIKLIVNRMNVITMKVKETAVKIDRLVLSLVNSIQTSFSWLESVADICNAKLGTPYDRCHTVLEEGIAACRKTMGPDVSIFCNMAYLAQAACYSVKPFEAFCYVTDFMDEAIFARVKKKLRIFTEKLRAMFHVEVHIQHSYSFGSNTSRSASQVTAGIVTEIRNRADPLLTWLSWSSCVTSLFLLLIIFRAKYYQHMYETRSRFDNRYVTKELQELDLKRQRQGRETVLPLNRRERAKYITTTSFRLVASEKVYLNRSAVFMAITTFKLLIHMVADYSLYWVLMTIRYHGRYQSDLMPGIPHSGVHVSGSGFVARLFRSIVGTLDIPLALPASSPISCLPDPYPPDFKRYTQIGVLIFLLWFFALFEPYGLRLRHLIMGHYRPERAKARAMWLYNHILRTRAGFMKFARRKLHREYKYSAEASLTFRRWMEDLIPCRTPNCPGVFCMSCFAEIGNLCTICLSPADYGDNSDVSLEKGSSDDSDSDGDLGEQKSTNQYMKLLQKTTSYHSVSHQSEGKDGHSRRWKYFNRTGPMQPLDTALLLNPNKTDGRDLFTDYFRNQLHKIKNTIKIRNWDNKYTKEWVDKLSYMNMYKNFSMEDKYYDFYSSSLDIEQYGVYDKFTNQMKSIGVNTDKNRGIFINALLGNFTRRNTRRLYTRKKKRIKKHTKKEFLDTIQEEVSIGEDINKNTGDQLLRYNVVKANKRSLMITKKFHAHNIVHCQRKHKKTVRNKKERTNGNNSIYQEGKGIIKAIRYFWKNNDIVNDITNQNNDTTINNPPIENNDDITKPSDNADSGNKSNKDKCSKSNKPKRPRKQKDYVKMKAKPSRHRIAEFHTFFSNHWNNLKYCLTPCTNVQNTSESPMVKEKRNHKRRKKRKGRLDINESDVEECLAKKDIKHTRNLRISAFLAEWEWCKRDFKKDKQEGNDNSFFVTDGAPAANTTNKIVGMVHMKNLPFQWREAEKYCQCRDKKCTCNKLSDKYQKILGPLSKHKIFGKKEKHHNPKKNISKAVTPASSLMQKMFSSMNVSKDRSPMNLNSSICISKRASFYQSFTNDLNQDSDLMGADMLFKNENYTDDQAQDVLDANANKQFDESSKLSLRHGLLGKELIISRNAKDVNKTKTPRRCRCDIYDDLQRKWAHVKNSIRKISDRGDKKYPFSIMKNFCSSMFGPSCSTNTCPNKLAKKKKEDKARGKTNPKEKKVYKKGQTQTARRVEKQMQQIAVQTVSLKDGQTQLGDKDTKQIDTVTINTFNESIDDALLQDDYMDDVCEKEKRKLNTCLKIERLKQFEDEKKVYENDTVMVCDPTQMKDMKCNDKELQSKSICMESKGVTVLPERSTGAYQAEVCPDCCHRSIQYTSTNKCANKKVQAKSCEKCFCNAQVQGTGVNLCTCATQHNAEMDGKKIVTIAQPPQVLIQRSSTHDPLSPDKKTQHRLSPFMSPKGTHYTNRQQQANKRARDPKSGAPMDELQKLSLEKSICVLGRNPVVTKAMQDILADTYTDTSLSSESLDSDETKTDTTVCSLATVDFEDTPRRRKFRVKVVTKTNQATLTDKTRLCDTGTITNDWWSPIIERRANEKILLEKKKGYNAIEKQKKDLKELKEWREFKEVKKRRRNCGIATDGRIVTFRSRTQIIPTRLFAGHNDIMSPSRYLLESQKYYNELFAYNFRPPPQMDFTSMSQAPRNQEKEKTRSPLGSRRNHHRKTKRLDECYSPRRQSPRKRYTESSKTSDTPRRRSYTQRHGNNRHYSKMNSPRRMV